MTRAVRIWLRDGTTMMYSGPCAINMAFDDIVVIGHTSGGAALVVPVVDIIRFQVGGEHGRERT